MELRYLVVVGLASELLGGFLLAYDVLGVRRKLGSEYGELRLKCLAINEKYSKEHKFFDKMGDLITKGEKDKELDNRINQFLYQNYDAMKMKIKEFVRSAVALTFWYWRAKISCFLYFYLGWIGFVLLCFGFVTQAYVNLIQLS